MENEISKEVETQAGKMPNNSIFSFTFEALEFRKLMKRRARKMPEEVIASYFSFWNVNRRYEANGNGSSSAKTPANSNVETRRKRRNMVFACGQKGKLQQFSWDEINEMTDNQLKEYCDQVTDDEKANGVKPEETGVENG